MDPWFVHPLKVLSRPLSASIELQYIQHWWASWSRCLHHVIEGTAHRSYVQMFSDIGWTTRNHNSCQHCANHNCIGMWSLMQKQNLRSPRYSRKMHVLLDFSSITSEYYIPLGSFFVSQTIIFPPRWSFFQGREFHFAIAQPTLFKYLARARQYYLWYKLRGRSKDRTAISYHCFMGLLYITVDALLEPVCGLALNVRPISVKSITVTSATSGSHYCDYKDSTTSDCCLIQAHVHFFSTWTTHCLGRLSTKTSPWWISEKRFTHWTKGFRPGLPKEMRIFPSGQWSSKSIRKVRLIDLWLLGVKSGQGCKPRDRHLCGHGNPGDCKEVLIDLLQQVCNVSGPG